jgi:hypothetical protein
MNFGKCFPKIIKAKLIFRRGKKKHRGEKRKICNDYWIWGRNEGEQIN